MGCTTSKNTKSTVVPSTPDDNSSRALLQQLKSKKESDKEVTNKDSKSGISSVVVSAHDDKSSSESEKRSAAIETFTWEVYTYADREESFKCIMNYNRSRMAFRAFFLGKSKVSMGGAGSSSVGAPSGFAMERTESMIGTGRDESLFAQWEKAIEQADHNFSHQDTGSVGSTNNGNNNNTNSLSLSLNNNNGYILDADEVITFFESMTIESVNLPSIPLVSKAKSMGTARTTSGEEGGSDKSVSANLQSLYLFFKSPMYLTWRAEESARVGEITATNLSMKGFSFRDSLKHRASHGNERCSLAELAFTLMAPPIIDMITNCSSWLGIFVAAAEGLPFALFLCECDVNRSTDAADSSSKGGYPIIYLNPPSAQLLRCNRRDVIENNLRIPQFPGLLTHNDTESNSPSGSSTEGSPKKSKVIVKLSAKCNSVNACNGAGGVVSSTNYLCLKSIFDQSKRARFVLGMHGDTEKMSSRRDVKMLEVLLGILPDNVTDDK
jgi:hypothetical protein